MPKFTVRVGSLIHGRRLDAGAVVDLSEREGQALVNKRVVYRFDPDSAPVEAEPDGWKLKMSPEEYIAEHAPAGVVKAGASEHIRSNLRAAVEHLAKQPDADLDALTEILEQLDDV